MALRASGEWCLPNMGCNERRLAHLLHLVALGVICILQSTHLFCGGEEAGMSGFTTGIVILQERDSDSSLLIRSPVP